MEVSKVSIIVMVVLTFIFAMAQAQSSPAPAPTSDCTNIDQGIAYVLMLLALVLTYLIH